MKKTLLLLAGLLATTWLFGQTTSLNVTLAGQLPTPGDLNDCWGWVDGNGKEYAITGIQSGGVGIVDISTPSAPVLVDSIPGVPSLWRDMKSYGNYVYVVNDDGGFGGSGLLIIDMSTLPNVVYKDTVLANNTVTHNLYIDNGYAYLTGSDDNPGITILDVATDPWRPSVVGQYTTTYVHDVYVRNDLAYSAELGVGLTIIDVSDKANPNIIGNRTYVNNFTHNTWLSDDSTVCFTTDEQADGWVYAWDVSDPSNIEYLDGIRSSLSNGTAIPHNTHVKDDFLVTSYYRDGLNIVDAQYPYNLIEVGYYDTSPLSGDGFDGNWGAYPFFPSGSVIASDMQGGLFVFNINYQRACYLEGTVTDASTNQEIPGANITVQSASWGDVADNDGFYATGTPTAGTYQVTYSAFGYVDSTITVNMVNNQLLVHDIPLRPVQRISATINVLESGSNNPIPNAEVSLVTSGVAPLNYSTNAGGVVNDPDFVGGQYQLIAGKWGYITEEIVFNASMSNPSITVYLEEGYYDDFALDFNWTLASNASAGIWERGEPIGTYTFSGLEVNIEEDINTDISDQAYVTGNGGGGAGNDDVDGGITILTSPVMDLSGYQNPILRYYRHFFNGGGSGTPDDSLLIEIDNGITTVRLNTVNNNTFGWVLDTFDISQFIAPTANVTVTFIAGDYGSGHLVEAAIDGFEVYDKVTVSKPEFSQNEIEFEIFPNPMGDQATVRFDATHIGRTDLTFELRDVLGRVQVRHQLNASAGTFDFNANLPGGVYFGTLRSNGEVLRTIRVVR